MLCLFRLVEEPDLLTVSSLSVFASTACRELPRFSFFFFFSQPCLLLGQSVITSAVMFVIKKIVSWHWCFNYSKKCLMFAYHLLTKELNLSVLVLHSSMKSLRLHYQQTTKYLVVWDFSNSCACLVVMCCVKHEGHNSYAKITVTVFRSAKSTVL